MVKVVVVVVVVVACHCMREFGGGGVGIFDKLSCTCCRCFVRLFVCLFWRVRRSVFLCFF